MTAVELHEYIGGLPNICGSEEIVAQGLSRTGAAYLGESGIDFGRVRSAFSNALHMHQPLIPAGGHDLATASVIGNLQFMRDFGTTKPATTRGSSHGATSAWRIHSAVDP